MNKKLILVLGIQGSGKTYWSKQWAEEDPLNRIRLNLDDIRCMLGKYWVPERENFVNKIFHYALHKALESGYDVVIDNMSNLNPKRQKEYRELIDSINLELPFNYTIEFKEFKTPLEVCIERDSKREIPIGESVIRATYERYKDFYSSSN